MMGAPSGFRNHPMRELTGESVNQTTLMAGVKYDVDKPKCALVLGNFPRALLEVSKVGTFGAKKYTENGWKTVNPDRYEDALLRHYLSSKFEDLDKESALLHLAHLAWNALAVLEFALSDNKT